ELEARLVYRLYCDTMLLEAEGDPEWMLLPRLLRRDPAEIDWELYRRKPRWIRIEHEFQKYDVGYLPLQAEDAAEPVLAHASHVFWARRLLVNCCSSDDTDCAA